MNSIFRCQRGESMIEFAVVILPVMIFIIGIMQTGFIVWTDNLLQLSVNTAARCAAVGSATWPCSAATDITTKMTQTANAVLTPLTSIGFQPSFSVNNCSGSGLVATVNVKIFVINFPLNAKSCYPNVS